MVANTSYMLVNVSNSFVATLGWQACANDYANQVFPAHIGLARMPPNVVGHIGLPNVTLFIPFSRGAIRP